MFCSFHTHYIHIYTLKAHTSHIFHLTVLFRSRGQWSAIITFVGVSSGQVVSSRDPVHVTTWTGSTDPYRSK